MARKRGNRSFTAIAVVAALLLAACGDSDDDDASSASPDDTSPRREPSIGDVFANVSPDRDGTASPAIMCGSGSMRDA